MELLLFVRKKGNNQYFPTLLCSINIRQHKCTWKWLFAYAHMREFTAGCGKWYRFHSTRLPHLPWTMHDPILHSNHSRSTSLFLVDSLLYAIMLQIPIKLPYSTGYQIALCLQRSNIAGSLNKQWLHTRMFDQSKPWVWLSEKFRWVSRRIAI